MASLTRLSILGISTLLTAASVSIVVAQAGPGAARPMYDVKTETMITGTVQSVDSVSGAGGGGRHAAGGTHLVVKTEKETLAVHVGPTAYLTEQRITLGTGDTLEILGSRIAMDGESVVIARQIKKGDNTWTLRDASGRPLWSGRERKP
jgi:hypothetical protein